MPVFRQEKPHPCNENKRKFHALSFCIAHGLHYLCSANLTTRSIMEKDDKQGKSPQAAGNWLTIGISLGVAFGIIFDNLAVWLCLGVGVGLLAPHMFKKKDDTGDGA